MNAERMHDELMPHVYKARSMCDEGGHRLLYLTLFGSHLYGTHSEDSDIDLVGIMLPNRNNLLLGKQSKAIRYSTGDDLGKNNAGDVDIVIYSLQYWLLEKLNKLEVNAVDLLYSYSNKDCTMWIDPGMEEIFNNPSLLFSVDSDPEAKHAYIDYAKNQVAKYGLKGTRVGIMKDIINWSFENRVALASGRWTVGDWAPQIISAVGHSNDLKIEEGTLKKEGHRNVHFLTVCGKQHQFTVTMDEFIHRMTADYARCGDRAKKALENDGVDWKACSHALRSLMQMEELFRDCKIAFPLKQPELLKRIKSGDLPWVDVEQIILSKFDEVKAMDKTHAAKYFKRNWNYVRQRILNFYVEI